KRVASDLKTQTDAAFTDIAVGDRIMARGRSLEDGKSVQARQVLLMTKSEIAKKQQADQAEWQKRGVTGVVTAIDPSGRVIINARSADGTSKPLAVVISAKTQLRRYAPESIKFSD